jgi:DNA-binding NarL/FixJ family response regulator
VKALALVRDLFFRSKIDAVARAIGSDVIYASTLDVAAARCAEEHPAVVFADLSDGSFPPAEAASRLRTVASGARLIGFASHVDLKALNSAREAGFEMTLSREEFTSRLPELLKS